MTPGSLTGLLMILGILAVAGYDLFAYLRWGPAGTISGVMYRTGQRWPLFPPLVAFTMGCLFGHFFL